MPIHKFLFPFPNLTFILFNSTFSVCQSETGYNNTLFHGSIRSKLRKPINFLRTKIFLLLSEKMF